MGTVYKARPRPDDTVALKGAFRVASAGDARRSGPRSARAQVRTQRLASRVRGGRASHRHGVQRRLPRHCSPQRRAAARGAFETVQPPRPARSHERGYPSRPEDANIMRDSGHVRLMDSHASRRGRARGGLTAMGLSWEPEYRAPSRHAEKDRLRSDTTRRDRTSRLTGQVPFRAEPDRDIASTCGAPPRPGRPSRAAHARPATAWPSARATLRDGGGEVRCASDARGQSFPVATQPTRELRCGSCWRSEGLASSNAGGGADDLSKAVASIRQSVAFRRLSRSRALADGAREERSDTWVALQRLEPVGAFGDNAVRVLETRVQHVRARPFVPGPESGKHEHLGVVLGEGRPEAYFRRSLAYLR